MFCLVITYSMYYQWRLCYDYLICFVSSRAGTFYTAGSGSGTIFLDDLACKGYESSLRSCTHSGWGTHNCGHHEDVGIQCY